MSDEWCAYWFVFWYGVGTAILLENEIAHRLLALEEHGGNFCRTFQELPKVKGN